MTDAQYAPKRTKDMVRSELSHAFAELNEYERHYLYWRGITKFLLDELDSIDE